MLTGSLALHMRRSQVNFQIAHASNATAGFRQHEKSSKTAGEVNSSLASCIYMMKGCIQETHVCSSVVRGSANMEKRYRVRP